MRRTATDREGPARGAPTLALLALLCLAALLAWPAAAGAAPAVPTLGTAALEAKLDASGTLTGYMDTVLKGSTIESIPVDVLDVLPANMPGTALIMFEATGPAIADIGGIASGMSGSPVYIDDEGTAKLVGAVSYGDWFTRGGLGLATPIEDMAAIEDGYGVMSAAASLRLAVRTTSGAVGTVVVAPTIEAARRQKPGPGTVVMAPLATFQIGGLPPQSRAYKALEKRMARRGITILPGGGVGAAGYHPEFTTAFSGGASVAGMASRGDLWAGAAGTVTYVNTDTVIAFGHPLLWSGRSGLSLANAWVHGVWSSNITPYKLISPAKLRGTLTQDRIAGIGGRTDLLPQEITLTAVAAMPEESMVVTGTSYLNSWALDRNELFGLGSAAAYMPLWQVTDAFVMPGSVLTTTTVVVSGSGGTTYAVSRTNLWDDAVDAPFVAMQDVDGILGRLTSDPYGIKRAHIESIGFEASASTSRAAATVVDVQVPGGIKRGANKVRTLVWLHGVDDTQTVETTLVVPADASLSGSLIVAGQGGSAGSDEAWMAGEEIFLGEAFGFSKPTRETLADAVEDLNAQSRNNELKVSYFAGGEETGIFDLLFGGDTEDLEAAGETVTALAQVMRGTITKANARIFMEAQPSAVSYGRNTQLSGMLMGLSARTARMHVLRKTAGASDETTVAVMNARRRSGGYAMFSRGIGPLTRTSKLTVRWDGDDDFLGAQASRWVRVRGLVRLTVRPATTVLGNRVRLRAYVYPRNVGSKVWFQRQVAGRWVNMSRVTVGAGSMATYWWRAPRGTHLVRAKFMGSTTNVGSYSSVVRVRVS